ncbi:GntR family transcriptional regulator [Propionivibrio sp.]|uniref:GntR family transcriptional regulator n=1 Tax=Propionivibrio sp. TaxID=2212460 RepID=UPI0039E3F082
MNASQQNLLVNSRRAARMWKDRGSAFPLAVREGGTKHERLREELLRSIDTFGLKPYDALPSEAGLCELYSVSRAVVRQTLEGMENDGLIFRVKGKGSFLAEHAGTEGNRFTLKGLYTQMVARGGTAFTTRILRSGFRKAPGEIAKRLGIAPGTRVYYLERLRLANETPWVRIESYIPLPLGEQVSRSDASTTPLHVIFRTYGTRVAKADRSVEVRAAAAEEIELMALGDFPFLLMLLSVHYDPAGRALEYSRASYRGDSSRLDFSISGDIDE